MEMAFDRENPSSTPSLLRIKPTNLELGKAAAVHRAE